MRISEDVDTSEKEKAMQRAYDIVLADLKATLTKLETTERIAKDRHLLLSGVTEQLRVAEDEAKQLRVQRILLMNQIQTLRLELSDTTAERNAFRDALASRDE
jgi:hypothetical protein